MEKENNEIQKNKSNSIPIILIISILIILLGFGYFLKETKKEQPKDNVKINNDSKQENEKIEVNNEEIQKEQEQQNNNIEDEKITNLIFSIELVKNNPSKELNEEALRRATDFITAVTYYDYPISEEIVENYLKGKKDLTYEEKLLLTARSLIINEKIQQSKSIPNGLKEKQFFNGEPLEVSVVEFNNTYKYLFNEEIKNYTVEQISKTCPYPIEIYEGKIYYLKRCGGTNAKDYYQKTTSIVVDDNNIYFYQEVKFSSTEILIVWKFDKTGRFISTESK